jgi:hypothetical protein
MVVHACKPINLRRISRRIVVWAKTGSYTTNISKPKMG